jgi:peptide/nickel transport system substrate-binding protein
LATAFTRRALPGGDHPPARLQTAVTVLTAVLVLTLALAGPAAAQDKPRHGGELTFVVPIEPASYDGHREGTFGLIHPAAPHYSTLLRTDPADRNGSKLVGDLAESWTVTGDARTYTFKIRRGVKFHDGGDLTSRDVKASYDKIIFPPAGVKSLRKESYRSVEVVEAPDPHTVRFRLKWPSSSFLISVASPFNWIYKADILAKDMRWYETNVMGSGPFTFVQHVKGGQWIGKKNPHYWDKGKPYLDGYRALFVRDAAAQTAALRGERAHAQFRGITPGERDALIAALGPKITVQESPWDCILLVAANHEKKPWDDQRARRALTLALDRYQASAALSKIAIVKLIAGVQVPGTAYATPPAELEKLAGYGRDVAKARAEARRLLREAGVPEGYSFVFKNRGVPQPYEPVGVWLVDQWRQIGLNAKHEFLESVKWTNDVRGGDYEVSMDTQCGYAVDPDLDLYKFQSTGISHNNYARYKDPVLDELYRKQSRALDPEERKRHVRDFERRLLDEEAHYLYTLQYHRIVAHSSKLRGWTITPSHFLNQQLDAVWLAE